MSSNIYNTNYEEKAIELIQESINMKMPLNQKSQEWYGDQRAGYLQKAIDQLNKKIKILDKYSKGWHKAFYGNMNNNMNNNNNNNNNNKSSNSSTKKNTKNSNYNANNENMSGGKRHKKRHTKRTRRYRK